MIARLLEVFGSLRFKMAAALLVTLTISIGAAMVGIWTYERDHFIEMTNEEARRGGRIIEKALRASMLKNDNIATQETIDEIAAIYGTSSRISIIKPGGGVGMSSDPAMRGQVFERFTSPSCSVCHRRHDGKPAQDSILIDEGNGPILRNVIKINNGPECHQCHPAAHEILGVLMYDANFTHIYDLLKTVAIRMLFTGLITFLAISVVLFLAVNRFIHTPIGKLMQGFIQVGRGNYDFWVEETSSSEFGYMADQFNVMNRAIGRFIQEIKGKNQETAILYTIVQEVSETIEWERLKKIIVDLVQTIFTAEQNGLVVPPRKKEECFDIVWRVRGNKRLFHLVYGRDNADLPFSAITREELAEWQRDKYVSHRFKDDYQRLLVPLHYTKEALGLICIKKMAGQHFSRHERAIIPALANHVAISLANSHLYHMAITDGLTGLYSKRHLLTKLDRLEVRNDKFASESIFVVILDIDYFKQVNDTYGHQAGDQMLMQLAELLKRNIRFEDVAFRYGGEEFVVLAPAGPDNTNLGMEIAERLRRSVEKYTFKCEDAPPIRMTISLGVAHFPRHGKTAHDIIRAADDALYRAKHNGRNQVCSAPAPGQT